MPEVANAVTMKGDPVTLIGNEVSVGDSAPDATLKANDLSDFQLSSLKGKKVLMSVVPSLDTPVCDLQTKRFNEEAAKLENTTILTISMDLPFAQKRWCAAAAAENIQTLSDFNTASFGEAYGVLLKGLLLLARSIFIVDTQGIVQYKQLVPEITTEPNYEEALEALNKI